MLDISSKKFSNRETEYRYDSSTKIVGYEGLGAVFREQYLWFADGVTSTSELPRSVGWLATISTCFGTVYGAHSDRLGMYKFYLVVVDAEIWNLGYLEHPHTGREMVV